MNELNFFSLTSALLFYIELLFLIAETFEIRPVDIITGREENLRSFVKASHRGVARRSKIIRSPSYPFEETPLNHWSFPYKR
jgi:hypothetical protein